jgi:hypothetical protein
MTSIWQTLSAIDCREHTEKKGGFDYLSWTWAWAMVKERFPAASYRLEDDIMYLDGTMEVRVTVTIDDLQHTMWLPVLNFKNAAISKPNAFDINSARMRCLVKCLAMFGLGHYIYAGESAPQEQKATFTPDQRSQFLDMVANGDGWNLKRVAREWGDDVITELFNSAPAGQKVKLKDSVRSAVGAANRVLKDCITTLDECESLSEAEEMFAEMTPVVKEFVLAGLSDITKRKLETLGVMA